MKMLELFAGTHTMADTFKEHGWEAYTVDWSEDTDVDLHADIGGLTVDDVVELCGGVPDVIWASPDCTTYSIAAISHHRLKEYDGNLKAVSEYATKCDTVNQNVLGLIRALRARKYEEEGKPLYYFIENPRGGLRKMRFMQGLPRYTVTYCQYGDKRMKPTDIWTNHPSPDFKPMCRNGALCHERAPRGSKTGTQGINGKLERARVPKALCEHIVDICENPAAPALTVKQSRLE